MLKESRQYIQGVTWDPCGEYVATLSTDRSAASFVSTIAPTDQTPTNISSPSSCVGLQVFIQHIVSFAQEPASVLC